VGGIRSAIFNLGLLKGIACKQKLKEFDYLSTVSGGGFVGSCLTAWAHRTPGGIDTIEDKLAPGPCDEGEGGSADGAAIRGRIDLAAEPSEVSYLREYSNYLTPRLGLLSADTWTLLAAYPRNLLLNWLVIVPLVMSAVLLFWSYVLAGYALNQGVEPNSIPLSFQIVKWTGLTMFFLGIAAAIAFAPRSDADEPGGQNVIPNRRRLLSVSAWATYFVLIAGLLLLNLATPGSIKIHGNGEHSDASTVAIINLYSDQYCCCCCCGFSSKDIPPWHADSSKTIGTIHKTCNRDQSLQPRSDLRIDRSVTEDGLLER
jgi:hypothetical protein